LRGWLKTPCRSAWTPAKVEANDVPERPLSVSWAWKTAASRANRPKLGVKKTPPRRGRRGGAGRASRICCGSGRSASQGATVRSGLATIDGVRQVLLLNGAGAISVAPADGKVLWEHKWPGDGIVQPAFTAEGDVLIGTATGMGEGAGIGMRRLAVAQGPDGWRVQERWATNGLKPYFNDFVVHEGHAYGFDGGILACVDLKDGARKWKGGRYGTGQLVLLPAQDLLLVLSEQGELALVRATPDQFTEIAGRVPAIEGKTWNHPVVAGDLLLASNAEKMAAFRLALAGR
jgi:hypothetical protein